MKSNLRLLLGISLLFGVSTGVYEYILPLFLDAQGISFQNIGIIFALSGLVMVIARIYMGGLADLWGRKPLYSWALAVCGSATIITPFLPSLLWQVLLKTFRDTGTLTRETLYPVILYEEGQSGFLNRIGKFRGVEYMLQAGGTLLAGVVIRWMNSGGRPVSQSTYQTLFIIAGLVLCLGMVWWSSAFVEPARQQTQNKIGIKDLFSFDLHPNLMLILISGIIFTFGMQLSHSFFLQLFFIKHFHTSESTTSWVMVLHRVTIALPLLIVGNLRLKNLRLWYIAGLIVEGATLAVSAVLPVFIWSAAIFLLHDFIGSGIWSPIQATLIQRYSRDETRGMEVGKVLAWSSLGSIVGPLVAGMLAERSTILPFLMSGIMMALAAIPLFWIRTNLPAPSSLPQTTAPVGNVSE
ncbi:MAG TPA: MFS transporter [Armatimonadota bacterium]|nr:MFS transporter [Armatimonadota bacterium]